MSRFWTIIFLVGALCFALGGCLFLAGCSTPTSPTANGIYKDAIVPPMPFQTKVVVNPCDTVDDVLIGVTWPCYHWTNTCSQAAEDQCLKPLPALTLIWPVDGNCYYDTNFKRVMYSNVEESSDLKAWHFLASPGIACQLTVQATNQHEFFRLAL